MKPHLQSKKKLDQVTRLTKLGGEGSACENLVLINILEQVKFTPKNLLSHVNEEA